MTKATPEKKAYKAALAELREQYHAELEENLKALVEIRKDSKTAPAVKVDAIRYLNQMLGLPRTAQEKPLEPVPTKREEVPAALTLRPELLEYLDNITKR